MAACDSPQSIFLGSLNHERVQTLLHTPATSSPLCTLFQLNLRNSLPYNLDSDLTKTFNSYLVHTAKILPLYHLRNSLGFTVILSFQLYTPTTGPFFQTTLSSSIRSQAFPLLFWAHDHFLNVHCLYSNFFKTFYLLI